MRCRCSFGVIETEGVQIWRIEEKPVQRFFVNAGMYALAPEALDLISSDTLLDMPALFETTD